MVPRLLSNAFPSSKFGNILKMSNLASSTSQNENMLKCPLFYMDPDTVQIHLRRSKSVGFYSDMVICRADINKFSKKL